jgi:hypothetical protein
MPCACKAPIEQYPENAEWGPLFWRLLHAMAERAGKQTEPIGQQDELRLWQNLLTSLKDTLPCDVCRNHYGEWLKEHPPELLELPYGEFHAWIKTWLWTLHNRINEGNDKPTFKFEDLHDMYKRVPLTPVWKALEPVVKKAIQLNGISLVPWRTWLGYVRRLQGFYQ